ncbi:DUF2946 domain-containing protein [Ideonella oryzae]|uniref:DUF2946 domain-containing protein n=1 Tax=Ideonella oryzae TaxID=2937441 RepID=A0ABT1BMQ8_9BURK|nr:DUF2946 domain-containing protein [Ideonella oryzae]MCO5977511.1 DUF2946 domain-containing protein [Ideonella oryzae]
MLSLLRHRCLRLSWVAFLAIFGLVFAPTISHAVALATTGGAWTDICSAQADGARGDTPVPAGTRLPGVADHFQHCPLCGLGAAPLLPPGPATLALPQGLREGPPGLAWQAPQPLFVWASAQPRAPPAFL